MRSFGTTAIFSVIARNRPETGLMVNLPGGRARLRDFDRYKRYGEGNE
jgi:hypothetical protein